MDSQRRHKAALLGRVRRVVIKIGSSILSSTAGIDDRRLSALVDAIAALRTERFPIVVVSSGAVAAGLSRLGLKQRPKTIPQKQAAAAVGQISLMALYEEHFAAHGLHVAQILLTHDDLANRRRYLNARHAFDALLRAGIVPIVNENDTVAIEEMRFGDNDNLSALVAALIDADLLVILSDVAGLFTAAPAENPDAEIVPLVSRITPQVMGYAAAGSNSVGTGGMRSKLNAAYKATKAGIPCIIASGLDPDTLGAVFDAEKETGTLFLPQGERLARRKHWIAHTLKPAGTITLDAGAHEALLQGKRSLLPSGVSEVSGAFGAGDCVSCLSPSGIEFARGLVNYSAAEIARIKGLHTSAIEGALGYKVSDEIIHRDDLVLLEGSGV